jgi:hypothetical protein
MQVNRWRKIGAGVALALIALLAGSWWAGQRPYVTPGTHQIFRMDSVPGAFLEFFVILILLVTLVTARRRWVSPCIAASYVLGILLVSLLSRRTIVNVGDSYCWDLWCVGIQNVMPAPHGADILYTAEVSLSVDSTTAQLQLTDQPTQFFYVTDEQGRRFPILGYPPLTGANAIVKPGEPVKSSLTFVAPASARNLYLTGDLKAPLWVRLYFGSDLNPFHRRTLLCVV